MRMQASCILHAVLLLGIMVMSSNAAISFLTSLIDSAPNRDFCSGTNRISQSGHLYSSSTSQSYSQLSCTSTKIQTRGFRKTALFFNSQNVTKDGSTGVRPVCDFVYISSTRDNLCNVSIPGLMETDVANSLSIRYLSNDQKPLTLSWSDENIKNRVAMPYPSFDIIYVLYNEAVCVGTPSPVYIPTLISTQKYFINNTNPGIIPREGSCKYSLNVFGYQTLNVTINSYYSRENSDCSSCYIQFGNRKLCNNGSYGIDVTQGQTTLIVTVHCNNQGSYGITASIKGKEQPHIYHMCKDDNSIIQYDSSFTLYSPNYAKPLKEELNCRVGLSEYNLIDINVQTVGSSSVQNTLVIGETPISLTNTKNLSNFRLSDTQTTWFKLQIPPVTGSVQYPAFSLQITAKKVHDIICPGGIQSIVSLDAMSLPYYVTSPGYPSQYPTDVNCLYPMRIQNSDIRQNAMVEITLDIEEEADCIHDFLVLDTSNTHVCGKKTRTYQLSALINQYNTFTLRFRSDISNTAGGFIMKIYDPRPPTTTTSTTQLPTVRTTTPTVKPQPASTSKPTTVQATLSTANTTKLETTAKTVPSNASTKSPQRLEKITPKLETSIPNYVWVIIGVAAVLLVGGAVLTTMLIMRKRRIMKANEDGFENPMFGEMSFNNVNCSV